jgi:hypothetical protein
LGIPASQEPQREHSSQAQRSTASDSGLKLQRSQKPANENVSERQTCLQQSGEFLDCASLRPGSFIDVETKSRHYQIECLGGDAIRISGHPQYCPHPIDARLKGSLNREGLLDQGRIECGRRFVFVLEDRVPVRTSKVLHVNCE